MHSKSRARVGTLIDEPGRRRGELPASTLPLFSFASPCIGPWDGLDDLRLIGGPSFSCSAAKSAPTTQTAGATGIIVTTPPPLTTFKWHHS